MKIKSQKNIEEKDYKEYMISQNPLYIQNFTNLENIFDMKNR